MTTRDLEIYVTVCEEKSFTQAAKILYLAQPSVSRTISKLEEDYGGRFFERLGKHMQLTEAGEAFLRYARKVLELEEDLQVELDERARRVKVRLGSSITIGTYLLPKLVKEIEAKFKGVEIKVIINNSHRIMEKIEENSIDLGLVEGIEDNGLITVEKVMTDRLVLVGSKDNPAVLSTHEHLSDLKGQRFVLREKGSASRDILEATLKNAGVSVNLAWESINNEALVRAVEENIGITALSHFLVEEQMMKGSLKEIHIQGLNMERYFYLIQHRNKIITPELEKIRDLIIAYLKASSYDCGAI
jgi:DNA-binding transcriptional LysR family regulator